MLEFSIITISSFVTMLDSITRYIGKFCFKKDIGRILPIFSIIYGVALGIVGFYTPNVEMGANLVEAIFIGLSAGAAATGINQVGKQLNKGDEEKETQQTINAVMDQLGAFLESIKAGDTEYDDLDYYEDDDDEEEDEFEYDEATTEAEEKINEVEEKLDALEEEKEEPIKYDNDFDE